MATMLKHVPSGEMYPFNENLARRSDMEQVLTVDPQFAEQTAAEVPKPKAKRKPRAKAKPKEEAPAPVEPDPVQAEVADDTDFDDFDSLDLGDDEDA